MLEELKTELERFGRENDCANSERDRRMLNITRETGEFLAVLVRATGARRILEIGTSNGYSTLWLAEVAKVTGGQVITVEFSEYKAGLAAETFMRSGLGSIISLLHEDAGQVLRRSGLSWRRPLGAVPLLRMAVPSKSNGATSCTVLRTLLSVGNSGTTPGRTL